MQTYIVTKDILNVVASETLTNFKLIDFFLGKRTSFITSIFYVHVCKSAL